MPQLADNPRTISSAAIKRASIAANNAVEALDLQAMGDVEELYRQAAADIAERIAAHAGADSNVSLQELQSVLAQVQGRLRELGQARDQLLQTGLEKAADLGVKPFAGETVIGAAASMRVSNEALNFVRNFVAEDGLQLSDRIWRLDRGARDVVVNAIEQAVIQGHGAAQAAREFLNRGQAVPIDVSQKLNAGNAAAIGKVTTRQLLTGTGNPMDNAMRLFRTEINRAHGEAYMKGGEDHPDFGGWRYLLSPAHPKPDICDLLSSQNVHGLGPGVYPTRAATPWPAHPNTLSFIVIVFKDEISSADRAGKETSMQALARLTPAQRVGVLGQNKTEVFNDGKLTKGMIRAPWKSVRKRIGNVVPDKPPAPRPPPGKPITLDDMIAAGGSKIDELVDRITRERVRFGPAFVQTLKSDLQQVRSLDKPAKLESKGRGAALVSEASRLFPDDWTRQADRLGPLAVRMSQSRGYYAGSPDGSGEITVRNFSVAVHEYAHRLQHALPKIDDFFQELHARRTAGDPIKPMGAVKPGYSMREFTQEDEYLSPYQGRIYSSRGMVYLGKSGALEVMSMAFEDALGGVPARVEHMLRDDREMLNLVTGLLYHYVP